MGGKEVRHAYLARLPARLSAYSLTPGDVQLGPPARKTWNCPTGKIAGNATELTVRTFGRLDTEEEFNELIIKNVNGAQIRLRDVGQAVLGPENEETQLKESNIPQIALALIPQPGSNYVAISEEFYKRYEDLKKEVPDDFSLNIAMDNTAFITKSIHEVEETLIIALVLVILTLPAQR